MNDVISELWNGFAAPKKLERERVTELWFH